MSGRFEYSVGEIVRIKTGAFQSFTARVVAVDKANATLKVMVKIFGRSQPIELTVFDVEKIEFREEE